MSANYLSKAFCFAIPVNSLRYIGEGSTVKIGVAQTSQIPVYFQSLNDSMGTDADGTGLAIYSGDVSQAGQMATPISFMRMTTDSITLIFGKPVSQPDQALFLDLFLWTSATGGNFTLYKSSDERIDVRYNDIHGEIGEMEDLLSANGTDIQW
ncbi:hypothetical protein R69608_05071 [Paraburkholderia nemoris]|uniref:hypothetical protein n=1 Tax=Paraburkholderia nemoris TaxID=2793076 RepID=UPI001913EA59|nr:hypothetical protein [Paraburkholderia nemoris]MBK5149722.1 hypothetical protein [Burkholderia sp. R-69608]CAE6938117.1 hypothetical protein R69608_05071 [Paraburkholderia nemoris]